MNVRSGAKVPIEWTDDTHKHTQVKGLRYLRAFSLSPT